MPHTRTNNLLIVNKFVIRCRNLEPSTVAKSEGTRVELTRQRSAECVLQEPTTEPLLRVIVNLVVLRNVTQTLAGIRKSGLHVVFNFVSQPVQVKNRTPQKRIDSRHNHVGSGTRANDRSIHRRAREAFFPVSKLTHHKRCQLDGTKIERSIQFVARHRDQTFGVGHERRW